MLASISQVRKLRPRDIIGREGELAMTSLSTCVYNGVGEATIGVQVSVPSCLGEPR